MNAKYGEDDQRTKDANLYIAERCAVEPFLRIDQSLQGKVSKKPQGPEGARNQVRVSDGFLWFQRGLSVTVTTSLLRPPQPHAGGHLLRLPSEHWVTLGASMEISVPVPRRCAVAVTRKGPVVRVLPGSRSINIRGYWIKRAPFFLRPHDEILSGVFFLTGSDQASSLTR